MDFLFHGSRRLFENFEGRKKNSVETKASEVKHTSLFSIRQLKKFEKNFKKFIQ